MKLFLKVYLNSLPLGLGIIFALISTSLIVNIIDGDGSQYLLAIIFGIAGYPMIIAGSIALVQKFGEK